MSKLLYGMMLSFVFVVPSWAQETAVEETVVVPDELEWNAGGGGYDASAFAGVLGSPGEEGPFVFRMRMPANWTMPPHRHGAAEHITVLSGTLRMKFAAEGETVTLPPGSFVSVPADRPMWAWTGDEEVVIQVHGTGPFGTSPVE